MFKTLRQLGSILLLSFIFISLSVPVFADEYKDCMAEVKQQAKNFCETFESTSLDECDKTKKFEGTTYGTISECYTAIQNKIDTCITDLETQNKSICDVFDPSKGIIAEMAKCIDEKVKTSEKASTLAKLKSDSLSCQEAAAAEHQNHYDSCKSITDDTAFNSCRAQADKERELKDTKCKENYTNLFTELSTAAKTTCEAELEAAKKKAEEDAAAQKKKENCGNKTLDSGEECDDGNKIEGDGCDTECKKEATVPPDIPKISTLVRPDTEKVSQSSPYLTTNFLPRIARTIVSVAIASSVFGLIASSIGLLAAFGNEEKYGNAKKGIYFSLIGLGISLLSFAIVQLIFFTGFQIGQVK
ncbi:hypothetical protein ACFLZH_01860 [Patescibacteria group bacterium]